MLRIPDKCMDWKVANSAQFRWWCLGLCGRTDCRLCDRWCRIAERHGMWTLLFTLGTPIAITIWFLLRVSWGLQLARVAEACEREPWRLTCSSGMIAGSTG